MDAQALASGSQDAMNSLTAGLYVAFDTTAIGLVLTMVAMFLQFFVNRSELALLNVMDLKVSEAMRICLTERESHQDTSGVELALKSVTGELIRSMQLMVEKQSELWQSTISEAHGHWQDLTSKSASTLQEALSGALDFAMEKHNTTFAANAEQIARIQSDGELQIDARWRQWQTTLSEQARAVHQQQQQMSQQTELLNQLIEKNDAIRNMEQPLQITLERLTEFDRFHEVAICMTEAVAVLGTQLERHGFLGRQAVRRRVEKPEMDNMEPTQDSGDSITIPIGTVGTSKTGVPKRRAG
jgi:uncharacterized protein YukE